MPKSLSSAQRTLRHLRNQGCVCAIAEKWNQFVGEHGIRQDMFGFIDIIALYPDRICAVQCCTSSRAAHWEKIVGNENAGAWLESGGTIELWTWRKVKKVRGGKAMIWQPRMETITKEVYKNGVQPQKSLGFNGPPESEYDADGRE